MLARVTINQDQELFVIPCDGGFSCRGFDVERFETVRLFAELGWPEPTAQRGTLNAYVERSCALRAVRARHERTGWRASSGLHPQLIGLEGLWVECVIYGETTRFIVGKSTGWYPCHLEIESDRASGGMAIHARTEIKNLKEI